MRAPVGGERTERFLQFYREYYREEIAELAQSYPIESRSLYIDYDDLYTYDSDLASDYLSKPGQFQEYAEEALRVFELPVDVKLGQAHVRMTNLPDAISIRDTRVNDNVIGRLVAVEGIIRSATEVQPRLTEAAFECQRCGTMTYIPQSNSDEMDEPHKCQGCERQGPYRIDFQQSNFVDSQTINLLEDVSNVSEGSSPKEIDVQLEDDIAGQATTGDEVRVIGVLHLEQQTSQNQPSTKFSHYLEGTAVEPLTTKQPTDSYAGPPSVVDVESYVELASESLGTLPENIREEETKAKLVTPFIEGLGWNKFDSTEVRLEYTDDKTTLRPDYALFGPDSDSPSIVVEAKQLGTSLEDYEEQLCNYIRVFSAVWGVLTNGTEFHVYCSEGSENHPEKLAEMDVGDLVTADIVESIKRASFYENS